MPTRYTKKDGTVVTYPDKRKSHGGTGGPGPNLTLRIDEALMPDILELAAELGHVRMRGADTGKGSISAFVAAIGLAVQREGTAQVAKRLRFIAKPKAKTRPHDE